MKVLGDVEIESIVKKQAKKNKSIIYGAQAISHQVFKPLSRPTVDWDIFSKRPRRSAQQLEKSLDKSSGGNWYYTKAAQHSGTWKVMDRGMDQRKGTKDDFGIADYTKKPSGLKTTTVGGVKFVRLSEVRKSKLKALRDKESKFRHAKDRDDLERIKRGTRFRRRFGI